MKNKPSKNLKVIFLSQAAGEIVHELSDKCASDFGKTMIITGSKFRTSGGNLIVLNAPEYNNKSYFSRLFTWTHYFFFTLRKLLFLKGKPILIISTNPPFLSILGYLFKKFRGWEYIVRILDVYPDALVQNKLINEKNLIFKLWSYLNRLMYRDAKHVITLGHIMAKRVSVYLIEPYKIKVIPDWVNTSHFRPIPQNQNQFLKENFQGDKLNVIYSGNLGLTHNSDIILNGAKTLEKISEISLTVIGGGSSKELIKRSSKEIKNLFYLPFQPENVLPFSLVCADIAIVILGEGTEGISMPSKLYYSMASGSAILSISNGENDLKYIVEKTGCGINVANNDLKGFTKAIIKFNNDKEFLDNCKKNSRDAAVKFFSSEEILPQYINILNSI